MSYRTTIVLDDKHDAWLRARPRSWSLSKFVRRKLDIEMEGLREFLEGTKDYSFEDALVCHWEVLPHAEPDKERPYWRQWSEEEFKIWLYENQDKPREYDTVRFPGKHKYDWTYGID